MSLLYVTKCLYFQVIKRLRERSEPIQLFGESESEAFFRLRRIEMMAPEINKVCHKLYSENLIIYHNSAVINLFTFYTCFFF